MEFQKIAIFSTQHLMIKIYQDLLLKNGLKLMVKQDKIIPMLIKKLNQNVNAKIRFM